MSNKIVILVIIDKLHIGGAENQVVLNLKHFDNHKFDLHFSSFDKNSGMLHQIPDYVQQHIFTRRHKLDLHILKNLKHIIQKNKVEIVHSHSFIDLIHSWFISLFCKVKVVHSIHGFWGRYHLNILKLLFQLKKVHLVAVSSELQKYLVQNGIPPSSITVVPNGIEFENYVPTSQKPGKKFSFGMVSRFGASKDHLTVCKAAAILNQKKYDFEIHFWGQNENEYGSDIKKYLSENHLSNVFLHGETQNPSEKLASLDAYIASSLKETFGLSMVEAMAQKLPVIASNTPVFSAISENQKNSLLFKTGDENELAEKMEMLLLKPELCIELGAKAHETAKKYSIETTVINLQNLYFDLLNK